MPHRTPLGLFFWGLVSLGLLLSLPLAAQNLAQQTVQMQYDSANLLNFQNFAVKLQEKVAQVLRPLPQLVQGFVQGQVPLGEAQNSLRRAMADLAQLRGELEAYPLEPGMGQKSFAVIRQSQLDLSASLAAWEESLQAQTLFLETKSKEQNQLRQEKAAIAQALAKKTRLRLGQSLESLKADLAELSRRLKALGPPPAP